MDKNTIEETDKRDGKVISIARMTVAADLAELASVPTIWRETRLSPSIDTTLE